MRIFKFKYFERGPHIHVAVYCGSEGLMALCGHLCFLKEEFWDFQDKACERSNTAQFLFEEMETLSGL